MPQTERSRIIIDFLRWLDAKTKTGGATLSEAVYHITVEVTAMGATQRRAIDYLHSCTNAKLVYTRGARFLLTEAGKNWLKRKVP